MTVPMVPPRWPTIVTLVGPPGAGKGTQAHLLRRRLGLAVLSLGDVLRDEVARRTSVGAQVDNYIARGMLVPDEIVVEIVTTQLHAIRRHPRGVVLDGFPRSVAQAQAIESALAPRGIDVAVELALPIGVAADRLRARGRADDVPATIERRFHDYDQQTMPMLDWLRSSRHVPSIDADQSADGLYRRVVETLLTLGDLSATERSRGEAEGSRT